MIVIKSVEDPLALRNAACVENLSYNQNNTSEKMEVDMVDSGDSNLAKNISMSIFSEASDLESTIATLDLFNTDEIESIFDDIDINT